ncbi:MAG: hypothetical protein HYY37_07090 [Candidatus Aenigmarchaeota archaeon]|nr:hypothetical protein [Candidatus Aenigmarchaeota archaeon]
MKQELLSQTEAAARAAYAARVQSVPHFPAPLSAPIGTHFSALAQPSADYYEVESQSAALSAAMGSVAAGKRTFLPMSIPHVMQDFWAASALRLPVVAANVSRVPGLFSVASDHNDVLGLRDAGWLVFAAAGSQEVLDSIIQAYRVCEDQRVLLPAVVNIDGIANWREPVTVPSEQSVAKLLPAPKVRWDGKRQSVYAEHDYVETRMQQQRAMSQALKALEMVHEDWKKRFKQDYGLVEKYRLDDAETVLVMAGFHTATAKAAVDALREKGEKVGLLRLRVLRPFPAHDIRESLSVAKKIGVLDQNISVGHAGILHTEVQAALCRPCSGFIMLGKHPAQRDISDVFGHLKKSEKDERIWL